jgi:sulfur carrier protein ThiS
MLAAMSYKLPFLPISPFPLSSLYIVLRLCYEKAMKIELDGKAYEIEKPMEVSRLLQQFSLSRETHLVIVNDRLVTEDHRLVRDDRVKFIRVVSGG